MENGHFLEYTETIKLLNQEVEKLSVNEIFALEKSIVGSLWRYADVRAYTDTISKGLKRFIVMENDFSFEIMRVECNSNLKRIYELLKPEYHPSVDHARDIILRLLDVYLDSTWIKAKSISNCIELEMFAEKVISYSWLQRKTSAVALFKNCGNPSELLRFTVYELVKSGELKEVPEGGYKTKAKLFKICIVRKGSNAPVTAATQSPQERAEALENQKASQLSFVTQELEKLYKPFCEPVELTIKDDIVVTFDDIRQHLDKLSQGEKRYIVAQDKEQNLFRILRQMDNSDVSIHYKDVDKEASTQTKRKKPAKATEQQDAPLSDSAKWLAEQDANDWKSEEAPHPAPDDTDDEPDPKPDTSPEAIARAESIKNQWQ